MAASSEKLNNRKTLKKRSKRGLASWLTTSETPLFLLDDRMVLLVFNHGCEILTGWSASDVIGQKCQFASHGVHNKLETLLGAICPPPTLSPHTPAIEKRVLHYIDGDTFEKSVHFFPLRDEDTAAPRILGIIEDLPDEPTSRTQLNSSRHFDLSKIQADLFRRFGLDSIIAHGPEMTRVVAQIKIAANCDANVLVSGEIGTGKVHTARTIHSSSRLKSQQFVTIDCKNASRFEINRVLKRLASDEKVKDEITVLLRIIEDLPRDLQTTVLDLTKESDHIRWMATSRMTSEQLLDLDFSSDLLCLLSSIQISIPPLRNRREDLLLLAQFLGEETNAGQQAQFEGFHPEVEEEFLNYHWPENIRELVKTVDDAIRKSSEPFIGLEDLPVDFRIGRDNQKLRPVKKSKPLEEYLTEIEKTRIEEVLIETSGNRTAAAEILGIPRPKLYRRLTALGLDNSEDI